MFGRIHQLQPLHPSKPFSFRRRLKEIDMFFNRRDPVHQTMYRLARRLEKVQLPYAIVGAMALNAHRYRRTTDAVDVLTTRQGFAEFRERFLGKDYDPVPGRRKRFVERKSQVSVDVLITGLFPCSGKPGPLAYPKPEDVSEKIDNVSVVDLATLTQLKLAARRYKDFGDVVALIRVHSLDEDFADRLHRSVRGDYVECLEEKRREDEYEAREG
jgi:hypothetical protein